MRRFASIAVLLSSVAGITATGGCSLSAHRTYRSTMTSLGVAAQVVDTTQTMRAMRQGYPEANPFLGEHPSDLRLVGGGAIGVGIFVAAHEVAEWAPSPGPGMESEWVKDFLVTLPTLIECAVVLHNTSIMSTESMPRR